MENFTSKEEAQKAFEEKGIEYPKYASGDNEGKIKGNLDALTKIYSDAVVLIVEKEVEKDIPSDPAVEIEKEEETTDKVVETETDDEEAVESPKKKPKFHRGRPKRFNPMNFKKK